MKEKIQNRQVDVKMLDIGWVFENDMDFRELIVSLAKSPHQQIFRTDLVVALIKICNNHSWWNIFKKCFVPYFFYLLFTLSFYTAFTSFGINSYSDEVQVIAMCMGLTIIGLDIYFLFYEFVGLMRNAYLYLTNDPFNYVDLFTSGLNLWLVFETLTETEA